MNSSRQFLLGLLVLGLQAGLATAQPESSFASLPSDPAAAPAAEPCAPSTDSAANLFCPSCSACCRTGLIGGVGLYIIQPYFQNNPAYNVLLESFKPNGPSPHGPNQLTTGLAVDRVNVSQHMNVAPLLWLGYLGENGFGGRARCWFFQQGTSQTANLPPFAGTFHTAIDKGPPPHPVIVGDTGTLATITSAAPLGLQAFGDTLSLMHGPEATSFNVTTKLAVLVADFEALQSFQAFRCNFLLAGGIRVARIDQTYNAYDAQSTSAAELRSLLSSYNFTGVGPTIALEARRPMGGSGLTLYSSARGALVVGRAQQNASFGGQELRNDDPNPQFVAQHRERGLPIGELEAGVEYGRAVGGSWLFGQIGLVGQDWFAAGSASRSASLTPFHSPNPVVGGAPLDSDIAFFGLVCRLGLNF